MSKGMWSSLAERLSRAQCHGSARKPNLPSGCQYPRKPSKTLSPLTTLHWKHGIGLRPTWRCGRQTKLRLPQLNHRSPSSYRPLSEVSVSLPYDMLHNALSTRHSEVELTQISQASTRLEAWVVPKDQDAGCVRASGKRAVFVTLRQLEYSVGQNRGIRPLAAAAP